MSDIAELLGPRRPWSQTRSAESTIGVARVVGSAMVQLRSAPDADPSAADEPTVGFITLR